jgi:hypothetical protein
MQTQIHTSTCARVRVSSFSTQTDFYFYFLGPLQVKRWATLASLAALPHIYCLLPRGTQPEPATNTPQRHRKSSRGFFFLFILLCTCPHTAMYVSSYHHNNMKPRRAHHSGIHNPLVLILLYMHPHTTRLIATSPSKWDRSWRKPFANQYVSSYYCAINMCPHTTARSICVLIILCLCPH